MTVESYTWISPFDEIDFLHQIIDENREEFRRNITASRRSADLEIKSLTRMNELLLNRLGEITSLHVNPPVIVMERPVLGAGLIVLPIKGSAL